MFLIIEATHIERKSHWYNIMDKAIIIGYGKVKIQFNSEAVSKILQNSINGEIDRLKVEKIFTPLDLVIMIKHLYWLLLID